jgi:hypothetical protein
MEYGMSVSRKSLISTLLAGGLLVSLIGASPANAAPAITLSINGVAITTAESASTPASVTVPSDNSVDAADAVRFSLTGVDAGTTVIVSATNSLILSALSTTLNPVRSTAGETSANFSVTTGSTSEFYAFTKSSQLGTITITNGGVTSTYYLRGTAGPGYTLTYTPNPKPFTSMLSKQTVKIVDVFGNPVVGQAPTVTPINLISSTPTSTNAEGVSEFTLTYPSTPGKSALAVSIPAVDVSGFPAAVGSISTFIDVLDPNSEIAAVTAALEAEKAARAADKTAAFSATVAAEKAGVTTVAAALEAEKAARAADKTAADAALAAEKAALTAAKDALDAEKAARASEKTARDAEKAAADVVKAADKATAGAALATADAALATEKAARATEKASADSTLAIERAARATEKAASDAALAAEKAARATEKAASDAALAAEKAARATEKAASDAALAAEKAARTTADAALTAEKAARTAEKAASDKSVESLTNRVATLTKQVADLKALYNKLAVKYKQPKIN